MTVPKPKKIWIDLDNTPHIPFFIPIIKELKARGFLIVVTARDSYQVCELADLFSLTYQCIGKHYGKNKALKVIGLLMRSIQLIPFAVRQKPDLALAHGSRSMLLLSSILNIPMVEIGDYEYGQSLVLINPDLLIVPEIIPYKNLKVNKKKVRRYPGIKEDIYIPTFKPDLSLRNTLNIKIKDIMVTIRPPATEAHYHCLESEILFKKTVEYLAKVESLCMVLLARNERQEKWIKGMWPNLISNRKIIIPRKVLNGLNLIWNSDFVISGGGTMNREAAALGVPVYSIFRGKIGAVDRYLSEKGRLILLENEEDVRKKIQVNKRNILDKLNQTDKDVLKTIVNLLVEIVGSS